MREQHERYWLAGLIALYTVVFSAVSIERFLRGGAAVFDLGIFDQAIYLLSQGKDQFLTTRGVYVQEDHFHPILFLVAPIYWIWSDPRALLVLQTVVIALGAIPAYKLARHYGIQFRYSLLLAAAYLCQPAVTFLNCCDFHPVSIMMTTLLFAVWALEAERPLMYVVALVLSLMCTEASAFTIGFLALNALALKGLRWGVGTAALAFLGLVLAKLNAARYDASSPYAALYFEYGSNEKEIVLHLLTHPVEVVSGLITPTNLELLFYLISPLAFLSLVGPSRLLPLVPALAGNLLSWRVAQHHIEFQYSVALVPFITWAALVGWKRLEHQGAPRVPVLGLLLLAMSLSLTFGPLGAKHLGSYGPRTETEGGLALIEPEDSVSADNESGSSLSQREALYMFPNPFVPMAWANSPEALIVQAEGEYSPLTRGALRRGSEQATVDWVVFHRRGSAFPLRRADYRFARQEMQRSPVMEVLEKGDLILLKPSPKTEGEGKLAWLDVHPTISEDGRLAAFEVSRKALEMSPPRSFARIDQGGSDLVVVDLEAREIVRRISVPKGHLRAPALSGDGRWLAYTGKALKTPHEDIYLTLTEGGAPEAVTPPHRQGGRGNCFRPTLSSDGETLAFSTYRPDRPGGLWPSTPALRKGHDQPVETPFPHWFNHSSVALSSDGSRIAWEQRLYLNDRANSDVVVMDENNIPRPISRRGGEPTVSNQHCVYVEPDERGIYQLRLYDFSSGEIRTLTDGSDDSLEPTLSADGRFLVFASYAGDLVEGDSNQQCDIFLLELESGQLSRLTDGDGPSYNPVVSADGSTVVFPSLATNLAESDQPPGQLYQWRRAEGRCQVIRSW